MNFVTSEEALEDSGSPQMLDVPRSSVPRSPSTTATSLEISCLELELPVHAWTLKLPRF